MPNGKIKSGIYSKKDLFLKKITSPLKNFTNWGKNISFKIIKYFFFYLIRFI